MRDRRHDPGGDGGFAAFVAANTPRLVHLAELLTGSPHDAPDLVQAALIRVYPRWRHIEADDPTGYIRRVMLNLQTDRWRRRRVREVLTDRLPDHVASAGPGGDIAGEHAQRELILGALGRLTARERQVVVLRYFCDLPEAAVAAEAGIAPGTVKSTLARALGRLRMMPELRPGALEPPGPEASGPATPPRRKTSQWTSSRNASVI